MMSIVVFSQTVNNKQSNLRLSIFRVDLKKNVKSTISKIIGQTSKVQDYEFG